jgi:hypothetical protein
MSVFWLGPLGALRALPSPPLGDGPEATSTRFGVVHRSLTGRPTVDRLGVRRTWTLTWPYLDPDTHAYLDTLHLGLIGAPLWLLDPQRTNQLPVHVASTGAASRSTEGFTATSGTLAWTVTALAGAPVAGGLAWNVPAESGRLDTTGRVPLIEGQPVTFSAYLAATRAVRLTITTESAAGALVSTHDSDPVIPGAAGSRVQLTATPAPGAVACRVAVTVPPGTAETVTTTGWQLEPGPHATTWRPGGAAAVVLMDSLRVAYPVPGSYATTATLLEV